MIRFLLLLAVGCSLQAQTEDPQPENKRIFWIVPNNRTAPSLKDRMPIGPRQKFKIATQDSLDPGTGALAALFAAESLATNANPEFGHGGKGYARYLATAYSDLFIGNFMTEAVYPTLLHQDPRYFRKGTGSGWSRFRYAAGQIFLTHADDGHTQFNYSEVFGNASAVAISSSYYAANRNAGEAASRFSVQLGVDMAGNMLKEFWPDLDRKLSRKHKH